MSNHFTALGRQLIDNGYLIVPIKAGAKSPVISSWQNARLTLNDLPRYPGCGVGILCGQGEYPIVGIDIDISHPVISKAVTDWCHSNMGFTAERVGAAPRVLLVYRAQEAGWAKGNSMSFFDPEDPDKPNGKPNEQQIEVLSLGQQFVGYHKHPDTGRDYEWTDLFGGIAHMPARDLPMISEAHIDALFSEMERLVRSTPGLEIRSAGSTPVLALGNGPNSLESLVPQCGVSLEETRSLIKYIDNSGSGQHYDTWVAVGMALHHEYGNTPHADTALALWKEWGSTSTKDNPRQYDFRWSGFYRSQKRPTTLRWLLKIAHQAKRDADLAARKGVLDEIKTVIAQSDDRFKLTGEIAEQIQNLMPDDQIIMAEVVSAFRARFKDLSDGVMLPAKEVKALLTPKKASKAPTVLEKQPLTEFGNAKRLVERYKHEVMYVPEIGSWYLWAGHHWRKATDVEIEFRAKQTVLSLVEEVKDLDSVQLPEFFEFCKHSQQAKMVGNMIRLAASEPEVMVPVRALDANHKMVGVRNGVVDLTTGMFRPGAQHDYIVLQAGCEFIAGAKCPLFDQTLLEVFNGDQGMADFFMLCIGYSLTGYPTEDKLLIPFGNGSNGKSTILGIIRRVFGDYAKSAEASSFISDGKSGGAGGAREDLVRLRGARFVYVNEPDEGGELREGMVKSMTGGDAITARGMYSKESVEIVPTWVVFMPTNHKPIVKGSDNGIWRRLVPIPFTRNFENDPMIAKDPKREEKLVAEMPGILNRMIESAIRYQRVGFTMPPAVKAALDEYRNQMDILADWLDECCELGANHSEEMSKLWESWEAFAKRRGLANYVRSSVSLGKRLDSRFPSFKSTGGARRRSGLRIKDVFQIYPLDGVARVAG